ncbi:hypothetical protein U0070_022172, partial [Myodes glareolus]
MAWSGSKAAVVLCLDVGVAMGNSFPGEESPFEQAKKVMTMFVQRQVFSESKDEIALVLFGTDSTNNALAGEDQYQNITVHRHLMLPDFDLLEDIESKIQPGSRQADYQLDVIICNLKKSGISLQFFLPFAVCKSSEAGSRGDGGLGLDLRGLSLPQKGVTKQQEEGIRMVERVMVSLEGEDGLDEIYSFSESLQQLSVFKKIERRSMPWPCQLTIGPDLSIKIVAYKSIVQEKIKKSWTVVDARTLKKEDVQKETVYCLNDDDETEVSKEDTIQGFRYGSDIIPFSKVDEEQMKYKSEGKCFSVLGFCRSSQVHRRFFMGYQVLKVFAAKDDEAAAVALSSLIHALDELNMVAIVRYAYDKRANPQVGVAFPYIKDAYEPREKRGASSLAVRTMNKDCGCGFIVTPVEFTLLETLLFQVQIRSALFPVPLRTPRAQAVREGRSTDFPVRRPDFSCLVLHSAVLEQPSWRRLCLVYVQLPFMEDLRQYMFSSLRNNKKCAPTEAQLSAVGDLIDAMSLVRKREEEDTIEDLFPVSKIPNPEFQRLFQVRKAGSAIVVLFSFLSFSF